MNKYMDFAAQFHTQLNNLLNEVSTVCADNAFMIENIQTFKLAYNLVKNVNSKKSIEMILCHVFPYREKVLAGDESFFLQHDFKDVAEKNDIDIMETLRFKEVYLSLSPSSKEAIKKYFKVLLILGEKALGL